jgi:Protein of unknown function (DUF3435)
MRSNTELTDIHSMIFFFTEINDSIFCPITHLVSLALADSTFEAPSLTTPERIFEYKVWGLVLCTPLRWKQEKLKTPIFRRNKRTADKGIPSPQTAVPYSQFRDYLNRLGRAAGFKETLTSYCFRRGTANIVDRKLFIISQEGDKLANINDLLM